MLEKNEWRKIEQFYQEGKIDQALALLQKILITLIEVLSKSLGNLPPLWLRC